MENTNSSMKQTLKNSTETPTSPMLSPDNTTLTNSSSSKPKKILYPSSDADLTSYKLSSKSGQSYDHWNWNEINPDSDFLEDDDTSVCSGSASLMSAQTGSVYSTAFSRQHTHNLLSPHNTASNFNPQPFTNPNRILDNKLGNNNPNEFTKIENKVNPNNKKVTKLTYTSSSLSKFSLLPNGKLPDNSALDRIRNKHAYRNLSEMDKIIHENAILRLCLPKWGLQNEAPVADQDRYEMNLVKFTG